MRIISVIIIIIVSIIIAPTHSLVVKAEDVGERAEDDVTLAGQRFR